MKILITGGGTGGHVSPALAVVQELRKRPEAATFDFLYIGSNHGIEAELAVKAGIPFVGVQSGKLRRARNPLRMLNPKNIGDLFRIPVGIAQAFGAVRRYKPDVVLATGGYVSVPPVIAAFLQKVPTLTHEQTVQIGLANRINGRFARRIALTFAGSADELPAALKQKTVVTGNPVRDTIFGGDSRRAVGRFGFETDDSLPCLYVTGGAQGSRIINRAIESVLPDLLTMCRIVHQCGKQPDGTEQDFDRLTAVAAQLNGEQKRRYFVTRFVGDEIGDVYALADLIVSRSGAGTVTEACALGKPALYIPLVPTGGDEQTKNAQRSVDAGSAIILKQADCTGANLRDAVQNLLRDGKELKAMGVNANRLATPNAARDIADALISLPQSR